MDEDLKKKILQENGNNELVRAFMNGEEVKPEDRFVFSCRACGGCCINTDTLVTPPEAARILWFMFRTGMPLQNLGDAFPGSKTGLPTLRLGKQKGTGIYAGKECCIFLSPVLKKGTSGRLEESGKWVCDIYPVRPSVCRSYPVARAIALETLPEKGGMLETSYCIQKRCPGFSMPEEQETLLAGYVKPGEVEMTVQEWTEKNENNDLVEEKRFYISEVIPTWIAERKKLEALGIPTKLDPKEICWNNQRFYSPPRPPENLDNDHEIIMRWLKALKAMPGLVFQSVTALNAICQQRGAMPTNEEEERAKDFYLGSIKKIMQGEETVSQERANVILKK